jgi:Peptidase family S41
MIICAVAVLAPGASGASADASSDIRNMVVELEQRHPNPYHAVSREDFNRAADELASRAPALTRDQQVVGVMRLLAMLGERDGHSGIHPLSPIPGQRLTTYPLRLYRFPEGLFVAQAEDRSLVGTRVAAIGGVSAEEVESRVRPLITRDNDWTVLDRIPNFVVCAEVLRGLGIAPTFTFELPGGGRRDATFEPISVQEHVALFGGWWEATTRPGSQPLYLRLRSIQYGLTKIDRGRALYVAYNVTTDPGLVPRKLIRMSRNRRIRRIVIDIRLNGGGNNTTYWGLISALRHPRINRPNKLRVLIGRRTFSAAGNFAADVDKRTRARLFGEPTGGAPSQWGDSAPIELPSLGLVASTAVEFVGEETDTRVTTLPNVSVATSAADFFAGRDPVLAAALR